ncbi:MAG: hypothetical protein AB1442_09375 [Nitrospirota bacterium]
MMAEKETIKRFVQKTLGCGCPEEVFRHIDHQTMFAMENLVLACKINVGNRLLIYVHRVAEGDDPATLLPVLIKAGMYERNRRGFNRFRLVLAGDREEIEKSALKAFDRIEKDEKVHLHIVNKDEIPC